jgi:uncharacterized iron-regulated membrane protein
MRAQVLWRKVHSWASIVVALPLLVVVATGLLLQVKKDFSWVQPPEQRGSGAPAVAFDSILAACIATPQAGISGWEDVARVDIRPSKSLVKVVSSTGWEVQLDAANGQVLQVAQRRSDLIESLHDGSWFGDWAKRGIFLPVGIALLLLLATGVYLFVLPYWRRRVSRQ